jgi:hypothetical protein
MKFKLLPKNYPTKEGGSCMLAAEIMTAKLLKRGIKNFKVKEGWVLVGPNEEELAHTWIEFDNGEILDPTIEQFGHPHEIEYGEVKEEFTPEEYLEACDFYGAEEEWSKWGFDRYGKKYKGAE